MSLHAQEPKTHRRSRDDAPLFAIHVVEVVNKFSDRVVEPITQRKHGENVENHGQPSQLSNRQRFVWGLSR